MIQIFVLGRKTLNYLSLSICPIIKGKPKQFNWKRGPWGLQVKELTLQEVVVKAWWFISCHFPTTSPFTVLQSTKYPLISAPPFLAGAVQPSTMQSFTASSRVTPVGFPGMATKKVNKLFKLPCERKSEEACKRGSFSDIQPYLFAFHERINVHNLKQMTWLWPNIAQVFAQVFLRLNYHSDYQS